MKFSLRSYFRERRSDILRGREDLHGYQDDLAVPFLRANPLSALFVDLGLGKSVITLTLIADLLFEEDEWGPWLVIGPKRVIKSTWPTEIREWKHLTHLTTASPFDKQYRKELSDAARPVARFYRAMAELNEPTLDLPAEHIRMTAYWDLADKKVREKAVEARMKQARLSIVGAFERNPAIIHLVNREVVEHLVMAWGINRFPYKLIVIDESQSFKSHKSGRFLAIKAIRKKLKRMHHLTATPAAESYLDLFAPMWLLDGGKRLGSGITRFRKKYFALGYDGWTWKIKEGAQEAIAEQISDICLTLKAKDHYPMTEPHYINRPVVLSKMEMARYRDLLETSVLTLPSGAEFTMANRGVLHNKLLQMASGNVYDDKKKTIHLHDAKIETLKEIIEEAQGQPVLVAYWFKPTLDMLKKHFPKAKVMDDDPNTVKRWNKKLLPIMFIHPQSGGAGLNLQHGGHILVIYDLFHSNELYTQLVGRLARQGQMNVVLIIHLVAKGTFDERVLENIGLKEEGQERLFRALDEIRKSIQSKREKALELL